MNVTEQIEAVGYIWMRLREHGLPQLQRTLYERYRLGVLPCLLQSQPLIKGLLGLLQAGISGSLLRHGARRTPHDDERRCRERSLRGHVYLLSQTPRPGAWLFW